MRRLANSLSYKEAIKEAAKTHPDFDQQNAEKICNDYNEEIEEILECIKLERK